MIMLPGCPLLALCFLLPMGTNARLSAQSPVAGRFRRPAGGQSSTNTQEGDRSFCVHTAKTGHTG